MTKINSMNYNRQVANISFKGAKDNAIKGVVKSLPKELVTVPAATALAAFTATQALDKKTAKKTQEPKAQSIPKNLEDTKARFVEFPETSNTTFNNLLRKFNNTVNDITNAEYIERPSFDELGKLYTLNEKGEFAYTKNIYHDYKGILEKLYDEDGNEIGKIQYNNDNLPIKISRSLKNGKTLSRAYNYSKDSVPFNYYLYDSNNSFRQFNVKGELLELIDTIELNNKKYKINLEKNDTEHNKWYQDQYGNLVVDTIQGNDRFLINMNSIGEFIDVKKLPYTDDLFQKLVEQNPKYLFIKGSLNTFDRNKMAQIIFDNEDFTKKLLDMKKQDGNQRFYMRDIATFALSFPDYGKDELLDYIKDQPEDISAKIIWFNRYH